MEPDNHRRQIMARNKHPEETRNLIVDTAAQLFIERGYDHTSIQDIIDHLGGLSKGAIYHHFKSKEEIMTAVAEMLYSSSETAMYRICSRTDLNGKEKLQELFVSSLSNPAQKDMFQAAPDMLKNPQLLITYFRDTVQQEAADMVYKVIEEGMKDGSIHTEYPRQLAEVMMLLGDIWLNPMVYHCGPEEMVEKVKFYSHLLKLLDLDIITEDMIRNMEEYARIYNNNENQKNTEE